MNPKIAAERNLQFIPYGLGEYEGERNFTRHSEILDYLLTLGFRKNPHCYAFPGSLRNLKKTITSWSRPEKNCRCKLTA